MTAEDRIKQLIGELQFQNCFLVSKLEEAQAEIDKLKKQVPKSKEKKDNVVKIGE